MTGGPVEVDLNQYISPRLANIPFKDPQPDVLNQDFHAFDLIAAEGTPQFSISGGGSLEATSPNPSYPTPSRIAETRTPQRTRMVQSFDSPAWTVLEEDDDELQMPLKEEEEEEENEEEEDELQPPMEVPAVLPKPQWWRARTGIQAAAGASTSETADRASAAGRSGRAGPIASLPQATRLASVSQLPPRQLKRLVFDGVVIPAPARLGSKGTSRAADSERAHGAADIDARAAGAPTREPRASQRNAPASDLASALAAAFANNSQLDALHTSEAPAVSVRARDAGGAREAREAKGWEDTDVKSHALELHQPPPRSVGGRASEAYWHIVDESLRTSVAPGVVLHAYAEPRAGAEEAPQHSVRASGAMQRDKGKAREWGAYTQPRWSRTADFKERLDKMYGPGSILRIREKRPRPAQQQAEDGTNVSDTNSSGRASRRRSTDPEAPMDVDSETRIEDAISRKMNMNAQGKLERYGTRSRWADEGSEEGGRGE